MTAITVQLAEWQTVSPVPGSPMENVNLGSDPSVLDLARHLGRRESARTPHSHRIAAPPTKSGPRSSPPRALVPLPKCT